MENMGQTEEVRHRAIPRSCHSLNTSQMNHMTCFIVAVMGGNNDSR